MKLSSKVAAAALALPLGLAGIGAFAASHEETAAQFTDAKVNIFHAIRTAERHHPGRAMSAEFEMMDGKGVYKVDIVNKQKQTTEVLVDARSGKVLSAKPDMDKNEATRSHNDLR